jgi:hypothetical protein
MTERFLLSFKLITTHVLLPVVLLIVCFFAKNDAFLTLTISQTILCIIYLAGYREFYGIRFMTLFCGMIQFSLLIIFIYKIHHDVYYPSNLYIVIFLSLIQFFLLSKLVNILLVIFIKDSSSHEIVFPFGQGKYLITDGGNSKISRLMNYHYYSQVHKRNNTNNSMKFAVDIVMIVPGYPSFLPVENGQYPVFGLNIYCPMDGEVIKVVNNIPDNKPYSGNYPYNTGNTVVIKKGNYFLLLGHLKMNSIVVKEGDKVNANDLIGSAGNSGWTERPHLHMQLINSVSDNYWKGIGVSVRFKDINLYKNRLVKI